MKFVGLVCCFLTTTLFSVQVHTYPYANIQGGQVLKNRLSPSIQPRVTIAPNVRPVDVNFQVTQNPFHPHHDSRTSKFKYEDSDVFRVCPVEGGKSCGTDDRSTCSRWGCCWNTDPDMLCSEPKFLIVEARVCGASRYYNPRNRPVQDLKDNLLTIMLTNMMQSTGISLRIIGGSDAVANSLPWMARIYTSDETRTECGGALIGPQWVLTAAHCLVTADPSLYTVVLGDHDARTRDGKEQFMKVSKLVHAGYNTLTSNNDIALLKLASPAVYNDYVASICVPPQDYPVDVGGILVGDPNSLVAGWGRTTNAGSGDPSPILQDVKMAIVPDVECRQKITTVLPGEGKFCAGGGVSGKDSCSGDSGGPLINRDPNDYNKLYVYGLVSYGATNCGPLPGVYTKVPQYSNWIFSQINS